MYEVNIESKHHMYPPTVVKKCILNKLQKQAFTLILIIFFAINDVI
jgi:hypothetical protein